MEQILTWRREQPERGLDEHVVLVRRKLYENKYTFFTGILIENTEGYVILYWYGDIESAVKPDEVEWALL
jgi:uncharacterized membrane protein